MSRAPDDGSLDRWYLLRAEINRVKKSVRVMGKMVAREIEAAERQRQSEEDTRDGNEGSVEEG